MMGAGVAWPAKPALTFLSASWCLCSTPRLVPENDPNCPLILAIYRDIDKYLARHFCSLIAPLSRQVPTNCDSACRDRHYQQFATCARGTVAILHGADISF